MASIDPERGLVVVRIVYDGPPRAGKTTSLAALGRSLGREVACAGERDGRTLWFDWMDYVGGMFDGRPIRCQVVTVPGQSELWPRRRALLESADAVVFVADSHRARLDADLEALDSLRGLLPTLDPPPAVILQANKRDLPEAAPLDQVRAKLAAGEPVAVTPSVAQEGIGIRETFVLAVRLALDRVRELVRRGELGEGRPEVDSAGELLAALMGEVAEGRGGQPESGGRERDASGLPGAEPEIEDGPASAGRADAAPEPPAAAAAPPPSPDAGVGAEAVPRPPDPAVPSGMIWPPVGGRVILHEAAPEAGRLRRLSCGGWADFGNPRWLIHSHQESCFASLEQGRQRLVEWARWHTTHARHLSSRRCVVLGEAAPGSWRLWQIVGRGEALSARIAAAFAGREPDAVAEALIEAGEALAALRAEPELARLRPGIDSAGFENGRPVFLGLVPPLPVPRVSRQTAAGGIADDAGEGSQLRELGRLVADELARWPGGRALLLAVLGRLSRRSPGAAAVWRLVVSTPVAG